MKQVLWYYGNILVAAFWFLNISFLSATGAPISISGIGSFRFADKSFNETLVVNNRTVQCSGIGHGSHYPSPMYTCNKISVDGGKLYHGYSTSSNKRKQECISGCPCGNNEGPPNDIKALCSAMLHSQGIAEKLVAAYVIKPSCNSEAKPQPRTKFYLKLDGEAVWEDALAPNGFINTLQCLTEDPLS